MNNRGDRKGNKKQNFNSQFQGCQAFEQSQNMHTQDKDFEMNIKMKNNFISRQKDKRRTHNAENSNFQKKIEKFGVSTIMLISENFNFQKIESNQPHQKFQNNLDNSESFQPISQLNMNNNIKNSNHFSPNCQGGILCNPKNKIDIKTKGRRDKKHKTTPICLPHSNNKQNATLNVQSNNMTGVTSNYLNGGMLSPNLTPYNIFPDQPWNHQQNKRHPKEDKNKNNYINVNYNPGHLSEQASYKFRQPIFISSFDGAFTVTNPLLPVKNGGNVKNGKNCGSAFKPVDDFNNADSSSESPLSSNRTSLNNAGDITGTSTPPTPLKLKISDKINFSNCQNILHLQKLNFLKSLTNQTVPLLQVPKLPQMPRTPQVHPHNINLHQKLMNKNFFQSKSNLTNPKKVANNINSSILKHSQTQNNKKGDTLNSISNSMIAVKIKISENLEKEIFIKKGEDVFKVAKLFCGKNNLPLKLIIPILSVISNAIQKIDNLMAKALNQDEINFFDRVNKEFNKKRDSSKNLNEKSKNEDNLDTTTLSMDERYFDNVNLSCLTLDTVNSFEDDANVNDLNATV